MISLTRDAKELCKDKKELAGSQLLAKRLDPLGARALQSGWWTWIPTEMVSTRGP